jgi:hypothetical protein
MSCTRLEFSIGLLRSSDCDVLVNEWGGLARRQLPASSREPQVYGGYTNYGAKPQGKWEAGGPEQKSRPRMSQQD